MFTSEYNTIRKIHWSRTNEDGNLVKELDNYFSRKLFEKEILLNRSNDDSLILQKLSEYLNNVQCFNSEFNFEIFSKDIFEVQTYPHLKINEDFYEDCVLLNEPSDNDSEEILSDNDSEEILSDDDDEILSDDDDDSIVSNLLFGLTNNNSDVDSNHSFDSQQLLDDFEIILNNYKPFFYPQSSKN